MPAPQAARIFADAPASPVVWEPVIVVTCVFERSTWVELDGVFVNDDPVLTWIADDGRRRGDGAPVLVAHVNPVLAARHLEDPAAVAPLAIATLQRVLGIDDYPEWVDTHRWTYAKPLVGSEEPFWRHESLPVGLAGDAWSGGPRVEAAWLSGRRLGHALAASLGAVATDGTAPA
jgi:predicted NAD/FAD-dependent oxidoreductase